MLSLCAVCANFEDSLPIYSPEQWNPDVRNKAYWSPLYRTFTITGHIVVKIRAWFVVEVQLHFPFGQRLSWNRTQEGRVA